jgi:hypothetical protein
VSITTTDSTVTRDAGLERMMEILKDQQSHKVDVVAPVSQIHSRDGLIVLKGTEALLTPDGVTPVDGRYVPTSVFDEGLSEKLGIPLPYVRKMRASAPDLYDTNVNGWLHGRTRRLADGTREVLRDGDNRSFLLRLFRGDNGGNGVARAMLSTKYNRMENLDIMLSALQGVQNAGITGQVEGCDLTDRRMYVRIAAPEIAAYAPQLLRNYRSPFNGNQGSDNPVVFAGIEIKNSEVGEGKFTITPRIVFEVCRNGVTVTKDALARTHLGARMDDGVIKWSEQTQRTNLELVQSQTRDAVETFLNVDYVQGVLDGMSERAAAPITAPAETITTLAKTLQYDEATAQGILEHFIKGADLSAGGVMHAVTSWAQETPNADTAAYLESTALSAMELAAASTR